MLFVRRWLPLLLAVVAVVTGGLLLSRFPAADHVVVDGVPLDVMRPAGSPPGPGVVVAHGYAGSAKLMRQFGDTLVARGYTVVLPDFDGHGANTRTPVDLQHDLDVAVTHLRSLPGVDSSRIALVGHSMGATAVTTYAVAHPDIAATVALSLPGSGMVTPTQPARLLMLVGQLEFPGFHQTVTRALEGAGSDRRSATVPATEHISILYASRAHRLTADWIDAAFGRTPPTTDLPSPLRRLASAGVLMLGLLAGFSYVVRLLLGRPAREPGRSSTYLVAAARLPGRLPPYLLVAAVSAGAALIAVLVAPLLPTTRLELGGYAGGFVALMGLAMLAFLRRARSPHGGVRPLLAALLLIPYAAAAIAVPLQLGFTHAVPVGRRWWLLLVVWLGFALLAYASDLLSGSVRGDLIVAAIAVCALTAASVVGLASGFLILVVPLLAVLTVIQAGLSAVLRGSGAPSWLLALTGSILVAWPIATTLPIAL
ncbi:dienelactone hydrolase family protein [Paractinoplanes lichenicola]|uniref:Alpha/beta fold hydrolase n=1 Tax=Paractinoplanes lichenicola TaxID=2802976 RepID=A0ABS1VWU1_9ACTN|nr:alpha/beta fold hydrolase [Actinoplanes lichenicola]MBL7258898.1 alpha/beta fold hydrolase [Actinoplanes lichenicola]